MPVDLLFADAAVEIIPPEAARRIKATRRQRDARSKKELLDVAIHNFAMLDLPDKEQRGRPDILHHCLLNTLDTPLAQSGTMGVYFHLRDGRVFCVSPETRVPRNYNRFAGVLTQLLLKNHVPDQNPFLMEKVAGSLEDFLGPRLYDHVCVLTRLGEPVEMPLHFQQAVNRKWLCVIGAFQEGQFQARTQQELTKKSAHLMSISPAGLSAGTVASRVIYAYEMATNLEPRNKL